MELHGISLPLGATTEELKRIAAKKAHLELSKVRTFRILKESVDARKRGEIRKVYSVEIDEKIVEKKSLEVPCVGERAYRPVVVGFGPAGMLSAYVLARAGMKPIVLERGLPIERRAEKVSALWERGVLDENANAEYGEGGAGAFSDGKLNSGIKDKELVSFVLSTFVECGAPEEILYQNKPHVGTDRLRKMVRTLREKVVALGGEVVFSAQVTDIEPRNGVLRVTADKEYLTDALVLAIGHSARDTYRMLLDRGFSMESKPFAVGVRLEQPQEEIDFAMYGVRRDPLLPAADYKVVEHTKAGGVYSFCMCPGGYVVCASSEQGGVLTNGMSYHARDGKNANAALLVGVDQTDFGEGVLAGVEYQREIERAAFRAGGGEFRAPCQRVGDFLRGRVGSIDGGVEPTYKPGVTATDLGAVLPERIGAALKLGITAFDKKIHGFIRENDLLTGAETRSSSPVRVLRGENYRSLSHPMVYPCGEGCGYAGGIMSAAVDGVRVALAIIGDNR
ncbi:MAG: hypothetical protein IJU10_04980 [Clostridia bacterium]|nr:hypothetical protein [Clostridia bacterium]